MILTGAPISAKEAKEWHIVTNVYPKDKLLEEAINLAKKITPHSQIAAAFAKRSVNQAFENTL